MSRQLSQPQQLFLQRLLAAHVLSDVEAKKLWNDLSDQFPDRSLGRDLHHTFAVINKSLVPNFSLEIKSMSLEMSDDHGGDSHKNRGGHDRVLYHAVVNLDADDVAKAAATPAFAKSPHDMAYIRLVFEKLIDKFNESTEAPPVDDEEQDETHGKKKKRSSSSRQGMGCQSALSRIDMVNLRLNLPDAHKNKLNILQVEKLLKVMQIEGWLTVAHVDDDDDNRQSIGGNKRKSTSSETSKEAKHLKIGPRAYLELPDLLKDLGLERQHIPQCILHA
jgi:hypothetical protein